MVLAKNLIIFFFIFKVYQKTNKNYIVSIIKCIDNYNYNDILDIRSFLILRKHMYLKNIIV